MKEGGLEAVFMAAFAGQCRRDEEGNKNARELVTNTTDSTEYNGLSELARNGGVIQMCILSDYVKEPEPYPARDSAFNALKDKWGGNIMRVMREVQIVSR